MAAFDILIRLPMCLLFKHIFSASRRSYAAWRCCCLRRAWRMPRMLAAAGVLLHTPLVSSSALLVRHGWIAAWHPQAARAGGGAANTQYGAACAWFHRRGTSVVLPRRSGRTRHGVAGGVEQCARRLFDSSKITYGKSAAFIFVCWKVPCLVVRQAQPWHRAWREETRTIRALSKRHLLASSPLAHSCRRRRGRHWAISARTFAAAATADARARSSP